jgi:transposase
MKREGREVWEQRVRRLAESGLTAREFAAELGVNVHTLNAWKSKLGSGGDAVRAPTSSSRSRPESAARFIEVIPSHPTCSPGQAEGAPEPFELVLRDGVRVRIPVRFDAQALRALVATLEAR